MAEYDYDLFVVGAGSGGVRAARVASELGARVGIAEMARMGGTWSLESRPLEADRASRRAFRA